MNVNCLVSRGWCRSRENFVLKCMPVFQAAVSDKFSEFWVLWELREMCLVNNLQVWLLVEELKRRWFLCIKISYERNLCKISCTNNVYDYITTWCPFKGYSPSFLAFFYTFQLACCSLKIWGVDFPGFWVCRGAGRGAGPWRAPGCAIPGLGWAAPAGIVSCSVLTSGLTRGFVLGGEISLPLSVAALPGKDK